MVTWKLLSQDEALESWDEKLFRFDDFTHSQAFGWGEHRSAFGWRPCRWQATDEQGNVKAMLQGLLRIYPGKTGLLWAAGGPVGDLSCCGDEMMRAVMATTGAKRLYCRVNLARAYSAEDALLLRSMGWKRALAPILSGMSMSYDPSVAEEIRVATCTKNWRHNLRRSEKYGLSMHLWENPDIDRMYDIYSSMQDYKQLAQQFSREELKSIFRQLGKNIVLYRCDDETGEAVSLRGCLMFGGKAWDMFAATSVKGRKIYASYGLFWRLMRHCQEAGVSFYDMSGIDPKGNPGVYDFKKGTGALPLEYLGEWEWASSELLSWGANLMIRRRGGQI